MIVNNETYHIRRSTFDAFQLHAIAADFESKTAFFFDPIAPGIIAFNITSSYRKTFNAAMSFKVTLEHICH